MNHITILTILGLIGAIQQPLHTAQQASLSKKHRTLELQVVTDYEPFAARIKRLDPPALARQKQLLIEDNMASRWSLNMDWKSTGITQIRQEFLEEFYKDYQEITNSVLDTDIRQKIETVLNKKLTLLIHQAFNYLTYIQNALRLINIIKLDWLKDQPYPRFKKDRGYREAIVSMLVQKPELVGQTLYFPLSAQDIIKMQETVRIALLPEKVVSMKRDFLRLIQAHQQPLALKSLEQLRKEITQLQEIAQNESAKNQSLIVPRTKYRRLQIEDSAATAMQQIEEKTKELE